MAPWPTQPTTKAAHAAERSRWQRCTCHRANMGAVLATHVGLGLARLKLCDAIAIAKSSYLLTRFSFARYHPCARTSIFANCSVGARHGSHTLLGLCRSSLDT